jgi:predicted nucleic acid-binding protein
LIVADASAVVEFLLGGARGRGVEEHFLAESDRIQAPAILDAEVTQALRRLARNGALSETRAGAAVEIFQEMPLTRHLLTPLLPRLWELRHVLTAYDAAYVSLAEALDCPLLTFDERLRGAPGHGATVTVPDIGDDPAG